MYVQQYRYYPGCIGVLPPAASAVWPTRLRSFTGGDRDVFNCPAQEDRFHWTAAGPGLRDGAVPAIATAAYVAAFGYDPGEALITAHGSFSTYGYNLWGLDDENSPDSRERGLGGYISVIARDRAPPMSFVEINATKVKRAAEMIAIVDSTPDGTWDFAMDASTGLEPIPRGWPGKIHRGGANVLFCDGHVTWYPQRDLVDFSGPRGEARRRMWHNDHEP